MQPLIAEALASPRAGRRPLAYALASAAVIAVVAVVVGAYWYTHNEPALVADDQDRQTRSARREQAGARQTCRQADRRPITVCACQACRQAATPAPAARPSLPISRPRRHPPRPLRSRRKRNRRPPRQSSRPRLSPPPRPRRIPKLPPRRRPLPRQNPAQFPRSSNLPRSFRRHRKSRNRWRRPSRRHRLRPRRL